MRLDYIEQLEQLWRKDFIVNAGNSTTLFERVRHLVGIYGHDPSVVWEIERYKTGLTLKDLAEYYQL